MVDAVEFVVPVPVTVTVAAVVATVYALKLQFVRAAHCVWFVGTQIFVCGLYVNVPFIVHWFVAPELPPTQAW